jgi:hypothetical protein
MMFITMFNYLHNLQKEIQKIKNKNFHSLSITQKKSKSKQRKKYEGNFWKLNPNFFP